MGYTRGFGLCFKHNPPRKGNAMVLSEFTFFYLDHNKLRKKVKAILKKDNLGYKQIAPSIGYTESMLTKYMCGLSDSRFLAGALCERFNLNLKDFMKEDN